MTEKDKAFNSTEYKNNFQKEKYDRIIVNVPKGEKDTINEYAKQCGYKSLNSFVVDAIHEKMQKNHCNYNNCFNCNNE